MEVLQAKDLKKIYGSGNNPVHALDGVDLSVKKGEFVAVVGTSGSGKSTLLHMLGGLDRPTSGTVMVDGQDIFSLKEEALTIFRRRKIGFGFMGVSSITTFVESTSGAADGGRTGLTSVTTGVLFILAAFFSPIVTIVSSAATCGALVYVGYLMMSEASEIDWSDVSQGFPAFMIVAGVPFTYSISAGIGLGFIAYVVVALFKGEASKIKPLMWIAALAFLVYFFVA